MPAVAAVVGVSSAAAAAGVGSVDSGRGSADSTTGTERETRHTNKQVETLHQHNLDSCATGLKTLLSRKTPQRQR